MRKVIVALFCLLLAGAAPALADETHHRQLAMELMELHNAQQMVEQAAEQVKGRLLSRFAELSATAADPEAVEQGRDQAAALIEQEFAWDNLKADYVDMYVSFFTEEELQAIVDFTKSPAGRKLQDVTPALLMKSQAIGQQHSKKVIPEVDKIIEGLTPEKQE
jgi:hypothetical protein